MDIIILFSNCSGRARITIPSSVLTYHTNFNRPLIHLAMRRLISLRVDVPALLLTLRPCPPTPRGEALALGLGRFLLQWLWFGRLWFWYLL